MLDHPKQNYPKSRDADLGTIQSALLSATGPLTCLWYDIIDSHLHTNEEGVAMADPGWGIWGKCPPPFKKLHTRSRYSNRAVDYSNKVVTMFMRQCIAYL